MTEWLGTRSDTGRMSYVTPNDRQLTPMQKSCMAVTSPPPHAGRIEILPRQNDSYSNRYLHSPYLDYNQSPPSAAPLANPTSTSKTSKMLRRLATTAPRTLSRRTAFASHSLHPSTSSNALPAASAAVSASIPSSSPFAVPQQRRAYHEKVIDHYSNPRNVGSLSKNDADVGTGLVGAPACGDVMKLQIRVDPSNNTIADVKFKTFGCGSAIASSSYLTELVCCILVERLGFG